MMREQFRVMVFDLTEEKGQIVLLDGRNQVAGGSGLAALLYAKYGKPGQPWNDEEQPLIFAIGPLTGYFPLMSKVVCSFVSPYHNQYTESHGGGRSALSLRFTDLDALVLTGKAKRLSCLAIGSQNIELKDASFMRGMNAHDSGKLMRRIFTKGAGHRSILRIGQAGEIGSAMACINVDSYRHFGRLGGGAVMGAKNLKGLVLQGDCNFDSPSDKSYPKLYKEVYSQVTSTDMMRKYYNLGTAANLKTLNDLHSLPWFNLQQTHDPAIDKITGEMFADDALLRNGACSGCPVGCIHIGYFRDKFKKDNRYVYHQVAYDYEPIFATGTMLGITNTFDILRVIDVMENCCLDVMSAGVALAWATEATAKGLISDRETIIPLRFGDGDGYELAAHHLGVGSNDFYRLLGQGSLKAAEEYGGEDFACVLGQEMAGYATGELYFAAQSLGFRHSHLDTGAYSWDQKHSEKDVEAGVQFLLDDEVGRVFQTSMVACLFARKVYSEELLADCLQTLGHDGLADSINEVGEYVRQLRWRTRFATGFRPEDVIIPKRFYGVKTWKGEIDKTFLDSLKAEYGKRLCALIEKQPV